MQRPLRQTRTRKPFPESLPRDEKRLLPAASCCPECGGSLSYLGEDAAEQLELMRSVFRVIRTVREKHACTQCDAIVQAPAPSRPIERGIAGPGLLARVLISKYAEHTPLYRQSEMYGRQGVELSRSLLSGWVDACCRLLSPLEEALQDYVLTDGKLHADDTPVPVLLPGNKKTKTGRLWTYVRDDRNAGSTLAPAVWFAYSPDRKGIHPQTHLAGFSGVLQADAYAGFNELYRDGRIAGVVITTVGRSPGTCVTSSSVVLPWRCFSCSVARVQASPTKPALTSAPSNPDGDSGASRRS